MIYGVKFTSKILVMFASRNVTVDMELGNVIYILQIMWFKVTININDLEDPLPFDKEEVA